MLLWHSYGNSPELTSLHSDILKMDIEFAEFESMEGLDEAFPAAEGYELPIGQLMIEIHFFNGMTAEGYLAWYDPIFSYLWHLLT